MMRIAFAAASLAAATLAHAADKELKPQDGAALYARHCLACHAAGQGHPGTMALGVKYKDTDQPAVLQDRKDLSPELVKVFVRYGVGAMPFFRKTEISDEELLRIGRYLQDGR